MPPTPGTEKPPAAFWRRRLIEPIGRQLTQGVSPEKIALTLGAGSATALFPILGTTTVLCILLGIVLKLNQPIVQALNIICVFIYVPFMVGCIRLGEILCGQRASPPNLVAMGSLFRQHPAEFFGRFGATIGHAALGWVAAAPFWAAAVYFLSLPALRAMARRIDRRRAYSAQPVDA
jgi:uncharacterized protein (DUF2062 family)